MSGSGTVSWREVLRGNVLAVGVVSLLTDLANAEASVSAGGVKASGHLRLTAPMREVINGVMRPDRGVVPGELYPYYQDVYDHILRVVESTDALRELVSTIVETNLSLRDYRQNQIMKKVTSWAAIVAVPTLVTGYYGMNVRYPGFGSTWAAVFSSVLMVLCSLTLYLIFKRRDWL